MNQPSTSIELIFTGAVPSTTNEFTFRSHEPHAGWDSRYIKVQLEHKIVIFIHHWPSRGNVQGVLRLSYELANFFSRFPNEFEMIGMKYRCKIDEVRNQLVHGRIDRQYGWLRHHSLGYLPRVSFYFKQVAEGLGIGRKILLGNTRAIRLKILEANLWLVLLSLGRLGLY